MSKSVSSLFNGFKQKRAHRRTCSTSSVQIWRKYRAACFLTRSSLSFGCTSRNWSSSTLSLHTLSTSSWLISTTLSACWLILDAHQSVHYKFSAKRMAVICLQRWSSMSGLSFSCSSSIRYSLRYSKSRKMDSASTFSNVRTSWTSYRSWAIWMCWFSSHLMLIFTSWESSGRSQSLRHGVKCSFGSASLTVWRRMSTSSSRLFTIFDNSCTSYSRSC